MVSTNRGVGIEQLYGADRETTAVMGRSRIGGLTWTEALMEVRSLGWLGVRTPNATAMTAFYRDVLKLEVILERPGATWFRLGDGAEVHVYGPEDVDHDFFGSSPVVGFWVDSFEAARAAMEAAGIEFIYPEPQRAEGRAWQHFRAPDGNVYEVIGPDDPPATEVRRGQR